MNRVAANPQKPNKSICRLFHIFGHSVRMRFFSPAIFFSFFQTKTIHYHIHLLQLQNKNINWIHPFKNFFFSSSALLWSDLAYSSHLFNFWNMYFNSLTPFSWRQFFFISLTKCANSAKDMIVASIKIIPSEAISNDSTWWLIFSMSFIRFRLMLFVLSFFSLTATFLWCKQLRDDIITLGTFFFFLLLLFSRHWMLAAKTNVVCFCTYFLGTYWMLSMKHLNSNHIFTKLAKRIVPKKERKRKKRGTTLTQIKIYCWHSI